MEEFFSRDLTALARQGALSSVYGRDSIVNHVVSVLTQAGKSNVVITGEPGVGKTTIVEGLAQKIAHSDSNFPLKNNRILELDLSALSAGASYVGMFEDRVKRVVDYLIMNKEIIVFIDEIHQVLGTHSHNGNENPLPNYLKPYLSRGEIRVIGASTNKEFDKSAQQDPAFARRFVKIDVPEPSRDEAIKIVRKATEIQAMRSGVNVDQSAIEVAVDLSIKYVHDRRLPDKAIDLLSWCISQKSLDKSQANEQHSIEFLFNVIQDEIHAINQKDWTGLGNLLEKWFNQKTGQAIGESDVRNAAIKRYGVLDTRDSKTVQNILSLDEKLKARIVGQNRAVDAVGSALKRMLVLGQSERPIGSFLFLGPTGVGKTELCRTVADTLWGNGHLLQYNMSEYMSESDASKLIGSSPGYIGYQEGGSLVRALAVQPSSLVLFDEIEKAHPQIHNLLLQILEEGKLKDGTGKQCSFSQSLVMLTSNVGAEWIGKLSTEDMEKYADQIQERMLEELRHAFKPEIINRIDSIVIFTPLTKVDILKILERVLTEENARLKNNGQPIIELTEEAREEVIRKGFVPSMGARPLRRVIEQHILTAVSEYILVHGVNNGFSMGNSLVVDWCDGKMLVKSKGGK